MSLAVSDFRLSSMDRAIVRQVAAVELRSVTKIYKRGDQRNEILSGVNLTISKGDYHVLMGPSGSGKTTVLNLMAGLDRADSGSVSLAGRDLSSMSDDQLTRFRGRSVGFVHQTFNLMPVLTACENVALPLLLTRLSKSERRARSKKALEVVGLTDRMNHYPRQLSGGQEQRVAVARAIVHDPEIVLADEPTGNLDRKSADELLDLLDTLNASLGKTIVMVTHDPMAAKRAKTSHTLEKGRLQ